MSRFFFTAKLSKESSLEVRYGSKRIVWQIIILVVSFAIQRQSKQGHVNIFMFVSTPDIRTTVSGEIFDVLLSKDRGINASESDKFSNSFFGNVMGLTCYLSEIEPSKKLTRCVKETVSKFSETKGGCLK